MAKYSLKFKLKVVNYYNQVHGNTATSKKFNIGSGIIHRWVKYFKTQGEAGLYVIKKYPKYTLEFKTSVLQYMKLHRLSYEDTAVYFNITAPTTVRKWYLKHKQGGILALKTKHDIQAKIMKEPTDNTKKVDKEKTHKQLLKELEYLWNGNTF